MIEDFEKKILIKFAEDKEMFEAVRKVMFSVIENPLGQFNYTKPNEQLGEDLRAFETAKELLEKGFQKLSNYIKVEELKSNVNEAR